MKESTKNAVYNALYYFLLAMMVFTCLYLLFNIGYIRGMTNTYKTELEKQIEMLEEEKQASMIRQILNEKQ